MRLDPLKPERLSPTLRNVHDTIVALMVRKQPEIIAQDAEGALIGPFPVMLHFPAFGIPALQFLAAIGTEAKLPPIVRETAILSVGSRLGGRYELYAHEIMAAVAGLDPAAISTLAAGGRPAELPEQAAIAHDVAAALMAGRVVPISTFERAEALLGSEGFGELVFLIGGYALIAIALNAFDMPVPDASP